VQQPVQFFGRAGGQCEVTHIPTPRQRCGGYLLSLFKAEGSVSYGGRSFTTRPLRGNHPALAISAVTLAGARLTRPAAAFIETCRTLK